VQGLEHTPTHDTRLLVASRKARGCTDTEIAEYFEINEATLAKHYAHELKTGKSLFVDEVFGSMRQKIAEGSERLMMFYMTHQAGWRSADKQIEVDALKENTAALERKQLLDEKTAELREARDK